MALTVTDIAIACMILPWLVFAPLAVRTRQRDVLVAEEQGRRPLYQEVCGGAIGATRRSAPFMRVALYDDFLVVGCSRRLVLRYAEIERLEVDGTRSPRALRLHLQRNDLPPVVEIWSPDGYALHERIASRRRAALDPLRYA